MGKGLLLGILDGIGEILGNLFGWLIDKLVTPLLTKVIEAIFMVVKYLLGYLFYIISTFLLQLVDLVEVLFRALAGLDNTSGNVIHLGTKEGDLLVQMLRSEVVIQAFLSCCIVGLFLLIITTIFQMLKVEYTSEGAQNSKSSIFGKSLKSLANLLLIPVLVIFGVVIGNSVLGLIDTATGGGDGSKISGLLWVTAASGAMWDTEGSAPEDLKKVENAVGLMGPSIKYAIKGVFNPDEATLGSFGNVNNSTVENQFIAGTQHYSNVQHVIRYYNLYEVNYLVLIFGACIVIKCLFLTCFGLIDRIYQCLALFIVSPFVIGMSPVKDSLGSWRSKFIQKALSAYGVIISLNLFFIIIKLFINLQITVNLTNYPILKFSESFVAGLIKSLFVIVGCLMIEKLAGDLGQYFGGGNALAEGKGLASEATKGLTTAAKVGLGVATGGAGLAMKLGKGVAGAAKGVGNVAGKIPLGKGRTVGGQLNKAADWTKGKAKQGVDWAKGTKAGQIVKKTEQLAGNVKSGVRNFVSGKTGATDTLRGAVSEYDTAMNGINLTELAAYEAEKQKQTDIHDAAKAEMEHYNNIKNDTSGMYTEQEKKDAAKAHAEASQRYSDSGNALNNLGKNLKHNSADNYDKAIDARDKLSKARDELSGIEQSMSDQDKEKAKAKEQRQIRNRQRLLTGANALGALGKQGLESLIPGPLKTAQSDWKKAMQDGNATSEGKAALDNLKAFKDEQAEKRYNNNAFNALLIGANRRAQSQIIAKAVIERAEFKQNDLNDTMNKFVTQWGELAKKTQRTDSENRTMEYLENQMRSINPKVKFEGNQVVNANIQLDLGEFKANIEAAIKKNASVDEINRIINEQLKKWGKEGNEQIIKEVRKAVEEIKNEVK